MEKKNYTFIYQDRIYYVIFTSKVHITDENMNYITAEIKKEYKYFDIIAKLDKSLKLKISNKINFNAFKNFLIDLSKNYNKKFKTTIIFNIDVNNYYVANLYTVFVIDENNNEDMIKEKIDNFIQELVKNMQTYLTDLSYEDINNYIYSSMYNIYFHRLILTIDINLYEYLVNIIYNDKYFNKNNLTNIDTYNLYTFEYLDETYTLKEYLIICKNCKEYHKSFYTNDKNKCKFICGKCNNYNSELENYKEHVCNVNKIVDYCNICNYYYKITKKHIPNKGDCYQYIQLIKKFINENRLLAIKSINKKNQKSISNKMEVETQTEFININFDKENMISYNKIDNTNKIIINIPNNNEEYELIIIKDNKEFKIKV